VLRHVLRCHKRCSFFLQCTMRLLRLSLLPKNHEKYHTAEDPTDSKDDKTYDKYVSNNGQLCTAVKSARENRCHRG
jgi:hypothetical protein